MTDAWLDPDAFYRRRRPAHPRGWECHEADEPVEDDPMDDELLIEQHEEGE